MNSSTVLAFGFLPSTWYLGFRIYLQPSDIGWLPARSISNGVQGRSYYTVQTVLVTASSAKILLVQSMFNRVNCHHQAWMDRTPKAPKMRSVEDCFSSTGFVFQAVFWIIEINPKAQSCFVAILNDLFSNIGVPEKRGSNPRAVAIK